MYTETWQTEVHQQVCADYMFYVLLPDCFFVCVYDRLQLAYCTYFSLCVSVTDYSWPTILISVCLCDSVCVSLWLITVGLRYLFLYVSVIQSVCLCDWLQLAYYTYFCMSLWFSLCVSVTNYSWPTILISVCLCVWLQLTCYTYFCVSLWLTAVGLIFLCVSVTDCSWPSIPISVCLSDIAFDLLYLFLCVSVTDCSWPLSKGSPSRR